MSYFHCGNGYPDRCNGYKGPLDASVCTSGRHKWDENGRQVVHSQPSCVTDWYCLPDAHLRFGECAESPTP